MDKENSTMPYPMPCDKPHIDVIIAYEPCRKLGQAYNRAMEMAKDWVLFLDQDVSICCPCWYEAFLWVVNNVGHRAGWISGVCNNIPPGAQKSLGSPQSTDLANHYNWAKKVWTENYTGGKVGFKEHSGFDFAGFTLLTHKEAWMAAGGFKDLFHVDSHYSKALFEKGYTGVVLPGVYFYHAMERKDKYWDYNKWGHHGMEYKLL